MEVDVQGLEKMLLQDSLFEPHEKYLLSKTITLDK